MRKRTPSAVLLITGSHVTALDFDLLLENLSRSTTRTADGDSVRLRASRDEQDGECGTNWASDDDLAPAREFINRQHVGEPWFCYVNPRIRPDTGGGGRSAARVNRRARPSEAAGRRTSRKSGHSR